MNSVIKIILRCNKQNDWNKLYPLICPALKFKFFLIVCFDSNNLFWRSKSWTFHLAMLKTFLHEFVICRGNTHIRAVCTLHQLYLLYKLPNGEEQQQDAISNDYKLNLTDWRTKQSEFFRSRKLQAFCCFVAVLTTNITCCRMWIQIPAWHSFNRYFNVSLKCHHLIE